MSIMPLQLTIKLFEKLADCGYINPAIHGLKGKLVRLLALGVGSHFEPKRNWGACRRMIQRSVRRVAARLAAAVRNNVAKEAEKLCASGQCAAALPSLQQAIDLGYLPSLALKAWMLIKGRESVAEDRQAAVELACRGMGLGCHSGVIPNPLPQPPNRRRCTTSLNPTDAATRHGCN